MKKCKRIIFLVLLVSLLIAGGITFSARLKESMSIFAQSKGNTMLSLEFQNALYQHLSENPEEYVTVVRDASDRVTAIQIHSVSLSLLSSELSVRLLEVLRNYESAEFGIPLGNLTSTALLSGKGPLIHVKPVSAGNIASELQSHLESAGINQTLHRVVLHFIVAVNYLSPLEAYTDTISFDIVIAETLVVGEVPILYRE